MNEDALPADEAPIREKRVEQEATREEGRNERRDVGNGNN